MNMELQYDSDMSEDTRELVEQGLAISRKKHSFYTERIERAKIKAPPLSATRTSPMFTTRSYKLYQLVRPLPMAVSQHAGKLSPAKFVTILPNIKGILHGLG